MCKNEAKTGINNKLAQKIGRKMYKKHEKLKF